jgi:DNA-binding NtrC family response regulator
MVKSSARILVVEDESLVAMMLQEGLIELGYDIVGPAPNARMALKLLAADPVDAAVLDVNLGDEHSDRVAEALAASSIPFIFATGYAGISALPAAFRDRAMINKPYRINEVHDALVQLLKVNAEAKALPAGIDNRQQIPSGR